MIESHRSSTHSRIGNYLKLAGLGGLVLVGATACNVSFALDEEGSGVAETVSYDFEPFSQVDISRGFSADITIQEGPPSVEVTVDDNLVERLDVKVSGNELDIDMERGSYTFNVEPKVVITMPSLDELDLSGAASATVAGVSGNSLSVDLSGASDATIDATVQTLTMDGSGAADYNISGSADSVRIDLSGAASADMTALTVKTADVDLSGGSDVEFDQVERLTGDLSGGSTVQVADGTDVAVNTSGGSEVERG